MEQAVFQRHQDLSIFPPAKLAYIIYRRLREQGLRRTSLWLKDKVMRRRLGVSPREISEVQPGLFVGGQQRPHGLPLMREWGIGAVVNMREEADDAAHGVALEHYFWLPTTDDATPSFEDLERAATFIAEQRAAGRGVYIHCAAGVGRAPLMVAAYLITTGMTAAQAWATIREVRPFIRPTPPQIAFIDAFARHWEQR